MSFKKGLYVGVLSLIFPITVLASSVHVDASLENLFKDRGIHGTLVIHDRNRNVTWIANKDRAGLRFPPASSFKIFNSLIGLESQVVNSVDQVFYRYKGERVFLSSWANDASLRSAIRISQVPAYKELARKIGRKEMQLGLEKLDYGNKQIGNSIDSFWLVGPLSISAEEQNELLIKLAQEELPFDRANQRAVKEILLLEKTPTRQIYGKTGWATENIQTPVGWFVGWVETAGNLYSFAANMDITDASKLPMREQIVREALSRVISDH